MRFQSQCRHPDTNPLLDECDNAPTKIGLDERVPFNCCAGGVRELIDGEQAYRTSHNISLAPLDNLLERL